MSFFHRHHVVVEYGAIDRRVMLNLEIIVFRTMN